MEAKQYATKQPMDHLRNQRGNQKIPRDRDFPGGAVDKTPCSPCRGPGFDPWSGN